MPNSNPNRKRHTKAKNAVSGSYRRFRKWNEFISFWIKATEKFKRGCKNLQEGCEDLSKTWKIVYALIFPLVSALITWIVTSTSRPETRPNIPASSSEIDASARSLSEPSTCLVNCGEFRSLRRLPPFDANYLEDMASQVVRSYLMLAVSESSASQSLSYLDSAKGQLGSEARIPLSMVWTTEGSINLRENQLEQAINAFRTAIKICPGNPYPYLELGTAIQAWKDTLMYKMVSPTLLDSLKRLTDEKLKCDSVSRNPRPQNLGIPSLLDDFFKLNRQSSRTNPELIRIDDPVPIFVSTDTANGPETIYLPGENQIVREKIENLTYIWTLSSDTVPNVFAKPGNSPFYSEPTSPGRYIFKLCVYDGGESEMPTEIPVPFSEPKPSPIFSWNPVDRDGPSYELKTWEPDSVRFFNLEEDTLNLIGLKTHSKGYSTKEHEWDRTKDWLSIADSIKVDLSALPFPSTSRRSQFSRHQMSTWSLTTGIASAFVDRLPHQKDLTNPDRTLALYDKALVL